MKAADHPARNCRDIPTEVFFPATDNLKGLNVAKAICAGCPVIVECLEEALRIEAGTGHSGRAGVYGGDVASAALRDPRGPHKGGGMNHHLLTIPAPLDRDGKPLWLRLNGGHGNRFARNTIAQQWRQATAWQAKLARTPRLTVYPVRIVATVHLDTNPSRWDASNWLPTAKHCVDGLVWSARHGGADVLADDSNRFVIGPDMRAGDRWADAALVLTIETLTQGAAS